MVGTLYSINQENALISFWLAVFQSQWEDFCLYFVFTIHPATLPIRICQRYNVWEWYKHVGCATPWYGSYFLHVVWLESTSLLCSVREMYKGVDWIKPSSVMWSAFQSSVPPVLSSGGCLDPDKPACRSSLFLNVFFSFLCLIVALGFPCI